MSGLKLQAQLEQLKLSRAEQERLKDQRIAQERLISDPKVRAMFPSRTGVEAGPPSVGSSLIGQLYAADPEGAMKMVRERLDPSDPKTVADAEGYQRYTSGPMAGQRAFPDVVKTKEPKSAYQFGNILVNDQISPARRNTYSGNIEVLSEGNWTPAQSGQFISEASPLKVVPNALGQSTIVDTSKNQQVWPPVDERVTSEALPTQGIDPTIDYSKATGGSGFFGNLGNTLVETVGWGLQAPDVEKAARTLDRLMTVSNLHMTAEMPGRPSNYIRERLAELEVKPETLTQGDERSRIKLEQIREMAVMEFNRAQDIAGNPGGYSANQVRMAADNGGKIRELIDQYDQILANWGQGDLKPGQETTVEGVTVKKLE
jgi:hypothetical protein